MLLGDNRELTITDEMWYTAFDKLLILKDRKLLREQDRSIIPFLSLIHIFRVQHSQCNRCRKIRGSKVGSVRRLGCNTDSFLAPHIYHVRWRLYAGGCAGRDLR